MPIKIDIVVHGRFHGFALARAFLDLGHSVVVHTNYPAFIAARWGLPANAVRSFIRHGISARAAQALNLSTPGGILEPYMHESFGRWAATSVRTDADLVYGFSGVMEEYLRSTRGKPNQLRMLVRGSSHIREQQLLLEEEALRVGADVERPSNWMVDREEREYRLADVISVLSSFALKSFIKHDSPREKLFLNHLGVKVGMFNPDERTVKLRERRILSQSPLNVISVGSFSYRKGAYDFVQIAHALKKIMNFSFVGDLPHETAELQRDAEGLIQLVPRVAETQLSRYYADSDIFIFPTIEDGFAAVVAQAAASGLPIIATSNCGAPEVIDEPRTGWIVPVRTSKAFVEKLQWCHNNRDALVQMSRDAVANSLSMTWDKMAHDIIAIYHKNAKGTPTELGFVC